MSRYAHPSSRTRHESHGLCGCGCGQPTDLVARTDSSRGWIKGQPKPYLAWHAPRRGLTPDYRIDENGCWIWLKHVDEASGGYGMAWDGRRMTSAHRVMYERHCGPIPAGMEIDHLCEVRACVNPGHLEVVTRSTNIRRSARTKLTLAQAREIKHSAATLRELCERFGVGKSAISAIRRGKNWRDA
jgi:hypothetical protein